jgi:predicted O-methyltransferase YrrM
MTTAMVVIAGILLGLVVGLSLMPRGAQRLELTPEAERAIADLPTPMSQLLMSMYRAEPQPGSDSQLHQLDANRGVSGMDGVYMFNLARKLKPKRTVEVGFAEGVSTLFFLAAVKANGGGLHVAIDPFERTDHHGVGLEKVRESGMGEHFRFMEATSLSALPALAAEGSSFEIIFIDGDHRFDAVFTDFILADQLCPMGGYILLHDPWMQATSKVVRYLERNRADYSRAIVASDVNIAVFRKTGEDRRGWLHFVDF